MSMASDRAFEAVILDMDGVITRTATLHARAWKQMFDEYLAGRGEREGQSYEPFDLAADYAEYVDGKPRYDGVRSFLLAREIDLPAGSPDDPPSRETSCGLGNRKNELFHQLVRKLGVEVYQDTLQQVEHWKQQGVKLAVISSSRNCPEILQAAGVLALFQAKVDGNDLERLGLKGKPAPDMFLHAASELGVQPRHTVVVEDAFSGVQAGRAGGFGLVVGVTRNGNAEELKKHGADLVVDDLRKLPAAGIEIHPATRRCRSSPAAALDHIDEIAKRLQNGRLALFLDYDGTLTPIVDRPEDATLSDRMRSLLADLSRRYTVAIVSGRDLANVRQMVGLEHLVYAGSHGFDIAGPGDLQLQHEQAQQRLPDLDAAERTLKSRLDAIEGVSIERKRFAIAIHYRRAAESDLPGIEAVVDEVCGEHPALRKKGGKKIFELQPDVQWHKGHAVMWLRQTLGVDQPDVVTIYIGDDETDEDAFGALSEKEAGLGILVGPHGRTTHARFYLDDCDAVQQFLDALLNLPQAR
jgi:trehalose 6-phosphate phosphatase